MQMLKHAPSVSGDHAAARPAPRRQAPPQGTWRTLQRMPSCACGGSCPRCQAKSALQVGAPDDAFEREADAVADRVMHMGPTDAASPVTPTAPALQRACAACDDERDAGLLQAESAGASAGASAGGSAPGSVDAVLRSAGRPLDADTRAFVEARFGRDFSGVQVHADPAAQQSARDVNAHAYTVGRHIVFGAGRFAPQTTEGRRLLSHELAHVVQQSAAGGPLQRQVDDEMDAGAPATSGEASGSYDGDPADVEAPGAPPPALSDAGLSTTSDGGDGAAAPMGGSAASATITLETGNNSGKPLNDWVHQQVCVDRPSHSKRCFSFAATGAQLPQFSSTWLGWGSWVTGAILQGSVYDPSPVPGATIASTHTPTVAQADRWTNYMDTTRLGLQDGYSVARHNCRTFSQWEFRDAPTHW
jgi:hypothetical protein